MIMVENEKETGCGLDETCEMDSDKKLSEEVNKKLMEDGLQKLLDKI